ncbi:glycosyltransferase [Polaribacter haliotis]|uniref:Glycosyltransferase n=1 Tax=Polaribacter haliotis TaxID=1888915 RepID=A0A7L8AJ99_9FLAO|nr:glycosyltransferase [Polaribacter haliotis]QOD62075.1 glycosyltransferase [Polaribacter haliotis]
MKVLINTTNLVIGGAIQVSTSFLEALKNHHNNEYHIFLSQKIIEQIDEKSFQKNFVFYHFSTSPASLIRGREVRKKLSYLELKIKPDIVFTVFGPSYWQPRSLHITGFADGWCYTPNSIAFNKLSIRRKIKSKFLIAIKNKLIKKSDYLIVETETAKKNIFKYLHYPLEKIFVVGNTFHQSYLNQPIKKGNKKNEVFKLLVLSAFYPHKNLEIINDVVEILKVKSKVKFEFCLTIPNNSFEKYFKKSDYIKNIGPQTIVDCKVLYERTNALFLPTLLETFTANYPEAMIMKVPILTSDLDFARELCDDAALYFDPMSPEDIASKIIELHGNEILQKQLVERGELMIQQFETADSRTAKYLSIFKDILKN